MSELLKNGSVEIREVWNHNLEHEFALIHDAVDKYPYIAMDTEFPGVVLRTVDNSNLHEFNYQNMKANVDIIKLIQLGLTFSDENGNLPTCGTCTPCIWQFNFKEFNVSQDIFNNDSIQMLRQPGIDFKKNELGIDVNKFAELLMSSGVVLNDEVQWITFHSSSDFGYLLKLLTCKDLPETQAGFFELFSTFFPVVYDIKHMIKYSKRVYGGLDTLAGLLGIERVGISHQAGSDSLLTYHVFKKLKDAYINGHVENYSGILFGLGVEN